MTVKLSRNWSLRIAAGVAVLFGLLTIGSGGRVLFGGPAAAAAAGDAVPFVLWCAGEKLANYEEAIWLTASGGGDVDTTCAMVGGIVSLYSGLSGIPTDWIARREPLPDWALAGGT